MRFCLLLAAACGLTALLVRCPTELAKPVLTVWISLCGTVILTTWVNSRLAEQAWAIWRKKSAEVLSIPTYLASMGVCLSQIVYGTERQSLALVFSATSRIFLSLIIVAGLCRFRKWTAADKAIALLSALFLIAHATTRDHALLYGTGLMISILISSHQPLAMIKEGRSGDLYLPFYVALEVNICFWEAYGLGIGDGVIIAASAANFVINTSVIALALRHRHKSLLSRPLA